VERAYAGAGKVAGARCGWRSEGARRLLGHSRENAEFAQNLLFILRSMKRNISFAIKTCPQRITALVQRPQTIGMLKTGDLAHDSPEIFPILQKAQMGLIFESRIWLIVSL
jgi:hypothetical protein